MKIVVGLPAYNEENNIDQIISRIKKFSDMIIICDDGSTDNTLKIAKKHGVIIIEHSKNLGYGEAIKSIFSKFLKMDGDILVTIDSDGQHDVNDIPKIIQPILDAEGDLVIGSRFLDSQTSHIPTYRKFGINAITKVTNIGTKQKITDSQSGFRAYKRDVLSNIFLSQSGMAVSTEILLKADKKKFRIKEIPTKITYGKNTSKHNPFSHGLSVLVNTTKFVSIEHPLTFYGLPGIFLFMIGIVFIVWTLQIYSESNQIVTNIALIGLSSIILSVLLIITAIILFTIVTVIRDENK